MSKTTNGFFLFNASFDKEALQTLFEDDISYACEVFEIFLSETKSEFQQIKSLYKENNIQMFRQKLHKIKPAFSFVGLGFITEETQNLITICDTSPALVEIEQKCLDLFKKIEHSFLLTETELIRMKEYLK